MHLQLKVFTLILLESSLLSSNLFDVLAIDQGILRENT